MRETEALAARGTALSDWAVVRVGLGSAAATLDGLGRTAVIFRAGFGAGVRLAAMLGEGLAVCCRETDCGLTVTGTDSLGEATCDDGAALADAWRPTVTFEGPG